MIPCPLPTKPDADGRRWFINLWGQLVYAKPADLTVPGWSKDSLQRLFAEQAPEEPDPPQTST